MQGEISIIDKQGDASMAAVKIVFSKTYFHDIKSLTDDERYQLDLLLNRIRYNKITDGNNREVIKCRGGDKVFSYRVNLDVRLAVYLWKPNEYLILACDHHDRLYRRVRRMKIMQVGSAELPNAVEDAVDVQESSKSEEVFESKDAFQNGLMNFSVDQIASLGTTKDVAESLRNATSEDALISLVQDIESPQTRDALLDVAIDPSVFEQKKSSLVQEVPRKSVDVVLKRNYADRENYYILTEDMFEAYFNGKLENWQVFLHPDQTRSVEMESNGPMMVTGPAGTGKSVVAVHRVKWLLTHRYRIKGRVLLTTFTHTLAEYAHELLKSICSEDEMKRVIVVHFDRLLQELLKVRLPKIRILYNDLDFQHPTAYTDVVTEACRGENLGMRTLEFIANEYDRVVAENDIKSLDQYQNITRPKDLGRLNAEARAKIWPILSSISSRLRLERQVPRAVAINKLIDVVSTNDCLFDSIVVDEAQDLGAPEYRLLAKLTGNTYDSPVPYSLFFAGDGHQRIYNRSGSLKQCGINVTGRSVHLVKCYRSTRKIREYAEKIIANIEVKDMDSEVDVLAGSESLIEGVPPSIRFGNNNDQKLDFMADSIRHWIADGGKLGDCAVLVRTKRQIDGVVSGLSFRGLNAVRIDRDTVNFDNRSVKVMTMHRAKGLQFVNVVVDADRWPQKGVGQVADDEVSNELLAKEKCLFYMSVMRAMSNVLITSSRGVNPHVPSDQVLF